METSGSAADRAWLGASWRAHGLEKGRPQTSACGRPEARGPRPARWPAVIAGGSGVGSVPCVSSRLTRPLRLRRCLAGVAVPQLCREARSWHDA